MKPLALVLSESEFLASLALDRLRANWSKKGFEAEEVAADDLQAVLYALDTPSLFGAGRFVIVRGTAQQLDPAAERFAAWAEHPPEGIAAAIVAGRSQKLKKALGAHAEVLEPVAPKPWETADWLARHVKAAGRTMTKEAAVALVEAIGTDLRELATAAEQLMLAGSGSIGVEAVARLFRGHESQVYVFLDTVLKRDRPAALRHLGALMRGGQHPLAIHTTLARQFRALAAAREAGRASPAELARELDLTPAYVTRAQKNARNFDAGEVRRAFRLLADADLALKGGEHGEDQPDELVMEMLVSEICGDRPAPAPARRR